jgi:hypothetical protein
MRKGDDGQKAGEEASNDWSQWHKQRHGEQQIGDDEQAEPEREDGSVTPLAECGREPDKQHQPLTDKKRQGGNQRPKQEIDQHGGQRGW